MQDRDHFAAKICKHRHLSVNRRENSQNRIFMKVSTQNATNQYVRSKVVDAAARNKHRQLVRHTSVAACHLLLIVFCCIEILIMGTKL